MRVPRAWGPPPGSGQLKVQPEDFVVEEMLDLELEGEGEHLWLWVEKRGRNTPDVAQELARRMGVPPRAVSWSGLKDRQALTRQWFSVHLPGLADPPSLPPGPGWQVLKASRHRRRLRIGTHRHNHFRLLLRAVQGERRSLEQRLEQIAVRGVPNYFGEQRFGRQGSNLAAARRWLVQGGRAPARSRRGLLLSAARSALFNQLLAARVTDGSWQTGSEGEVWMLHGSNSLFQADWTPELKARIAAGDVHPTGPLCGAEAGRLPTGAALLRERQLLADEMELQRGLAAAGARHARRSLRLLPRQLDWSWPDDDQLALRFALPAGCFATVLVRELIELDADPEGREERGGVSRPGSGDREAPGSCAGHHG